MILQDVARDGSRFGLTIQRSDFVDALERLIEDGLAKAYILSGTTGPDPFAGELPGMPELEVLIRERMASGAFHSVDELLMDAFRPPPSKPAPVPSQEEFHRQRLFECLKQAGSDWNLKRHPELEQGAAHWVDSLRHDDEKIDAATAPR